jgi:hypothetical protein
MRVVTTVHKAGFEQYGQRWVESTKNWHDPTHFVMYAEGFELPRSATDDYGIEYKRVEWLARLEAFKQKYAHYRPISWQWDVVRFSNKVFAAYDAFYDYEGLGVWLDCDTVTYKPLPEGYIKRLLPEGAFLGVFNRIGYHTETGFWLMDCSHPQKKAFLDAMLEWYESGAFAKLHEWHDCTVMDAVMRKFAKDDRVKIHSLSGEFAKEMHPIAKSDLGKFLDHCKGARKAAGVSPENEHRAAA